MEGLLAGGSECCGADHAGVMLVFEGIDALLSTSHLTHVRRHLGMQAVRRELEALLERRSSEVQALGEDAEVTYVVRMLVYLEDRLR